MPILRSAPRGGESERTFVPFSRSVAASTQIIGVPSVARREILASLGLSLSPVSKFFHRRQ